MNQTISAELAIYGNFYKYKKSYFFKLNKIYYDKSTYLLFLQSNVISYYHGKNTVSGGRMMVGVKEKKWLVLVVVSVGATLVPGVGQFDRVGLDKKEGYYISRLFFIGNLPLG